MREAEPRQRLAAILAADAADWLRLVSKDERAALASLDAARLIFRAVIEANQGRLVEGTGHAMLAVFDTAIDAVQAAIDVQRQLAAATAGAAPDARLQFRIGLHLGDVVEGADGVVDGRGVEIASELKTSAEPGGTAVSQSIQIAVRGSTVAHFADLGERRLNEVEEPLRIYRLTDGETLAEAAEAPDTGAREPWFTRWSGAVKRARGVIAAIAAVGAVLGGVLGYWNTYRAVQELGTAAPAGMSANGSKPADAGPLSIVVLPFANLTGDAEQGYVADGLTASITADLSRIVDAFVVGPGTAMAFKDKPLKAQQVGQELGVRFVLQGNVQRSGHRIRINAQLIDTASNAQLWAETFEGESSDLFTLQDAVTTLIGNSMGRELVVRAARESDRRSSNATVTDLLLRARALQLRPQSLANWRQIEALYREALTLEPTNVGATLMLARSLILQSVNFGKELRPFAWVNKTDEAAELAARVRDANSGADDPQLEEVLGLVAAVRGDFAGALRAFELRLRLQPKAPAAYLDLSDAYYRQAEPQPALALLQQGLALDPKHPLDTLLAALASAEFMRGDYDAAIEWGLRAKAANPTWYGRFRVLAMAYALKGDRASARSAAAAAFKADPANTISSALYRLDLPLIPVHPAYRTWAIQHEIPAMRLAGFPE